MTDAARCTVPKEEQLLLKSLLSDVEDVLQSAEKLSRLP